MVAAVCRIPLEFRALGKVSVVELVARSGDLERRDPYRYPNTAA